VKIAVLLCLVVPSLCLAQLSVDYDRFKDRTEVSASKPASLGRQLMFAGVYKGQTLKEPPAAVSVIFLSTAKSWEYLRCGDALFLADGKPVPTVNTSHRGDVMRSAGGVIETVTVTIGWEQALALASANAVETRMCRTEYTLDATDMDNLRKVVKALNPVK
jgi:hypothetical protein